MGIEKQNSKGGNYVGGFLQMFDWNAKSRKKLFSSKPEVPEQSKQKKRCDGNLPMTRLHMVNVDEDAAGSSVKGSSDHSCASSVVDEDFYGTRAPGVVARLMGLDSLPKSSMHEPYSTPLFDACSLRNAYSQTKKFGHHQDQTMHSSSLQDVLIRNEMEPSYQRVVIHKPIDKFQTEMLPPKSAKSIPITHHKLLSPIKSANFIPPKDAAHIMEAAARIFEPGPQVSTKSKLPPLGSSSAPLRVRSLKEKAEAAQKPSKLFEGSRRKAEPSAVKNFRENSMNKSWNGSVGAPPIRVMPDSDETCIGMKSKGKSISLALQAKANVQKRGGLNVNDSSRSLICQKESSEVSPNHPFKSQSTTQKSMVNKPSMQNGSSVLQQNNQKQNCIVDRGKLSSKGNSKGAKTFSGESSTRLYSSGKVSNTSRVNNSRKLRSEFKDDKREVLSSSRERVASKKRSIDGSYHHSGKSQTAQNLQMERRSKNIQSSDNTESHSSWDQNSAGAEVISFTFTAPMARLGPDSGRPRKAEETCKTLSAGYQNKKSSLSMSGSRFSFHGNNNVKGGDALSTLLEQKLKELADKVEFSQQNSGTDLYDTAVSGFEATTSSGMTETYEAGDEMHTLNEVRLEETSTSDGTISRDRKLLDRRLPSPVSVLEHDHPSLTDSCSSSDTADSNITESIKQCSSVQAVEVLDSYSLKTYLAGEPDADLSDSASSTSTGTVLKRHEGSILTSTDCVNPRSWEFEYVKEMLSNIELMFNDYAVGRTKDIVKPHLFYQLETCYQDSSYSVDIPLIDQRLVFDCVSECLNLRCRQYVGGGYRSYASLVRSKDNFAREVYKEVSGWNANSGDSMIDELVDKDMSSQYGRWLEFDVEAYELGTHIQSRILNSLIDEVVADILML